MDSFSFAWDNDKASDNLIKHKVSFEEVSTVFEDFLSYTFDDELHSANEPREITIGSSKRNRLLVVVSTTQDDIIRIISVREVTKFERKDYENNADR